MGEFGFITADGVYHVTVYATDENGNFKILSMKNIRVKPYPTTAAANDVRTGHSLSLPPQNSASNPVQSRSTFAPQSQAPSSSKLSTSQQDQELSNNKPSSPKPIIEPPRACSHCIIPTTTTVRPAYSRENVGDISLNTQNGFRSTGDSNSRLNNANVAQDRAIVQIPNNKEQQPQSNEFNIGNSPASYEKGSLFMNINFGSSNSKPISSDDAQNYNTPMSYFGINQYQPINNGNNDEQNVNQNPVGSIPLQQSKPQQFNPYQNSGNNDLKQQFGSEPNTNSNNLGINNDGNKVMSNGNKYGIRNNDGNDYGQNSPQNAFDQQGSEYDSDNLQGERNPKQLGTSRQTPTGKNGQNAAGNFGESDSGKLEKPVLISAQMQIVDKNTDINYKKPGEVDGLPKGLTKGDMENLLYTFNYTLAFHGHYEEGYTSGAKQGYYFVTGRNGVRTRIDYVADENGFRPKITQEVLDLISDEVPKPETEKDEKYGLKGYEFKWLYFPVGSNQR